MSRRPYNNDLCQIRSPQNLELETLQLEGRVNVLFGAIKSANDLAQAAYDLAAAGGGGGGGEFTATLFNTIGTSTLRGVDVVGFVDAADNIDARLTDLGV